MRWSARWGWVEPLWVPDPTYMCVLFTKFLLQPGHTHTAPSDLPSIPRMRTQKFGSSPCPGTAPEPRADRFQESCSAKHTASLARKRRGRQVVKALGAFPHRVRWEPTACRPSKGTTFKAKERCHQEAHPTYSLCRGGCRLLGAGCGQEGGVPQTPSRFPAQDFRDCRLTATACDQITPFAPFPALANQCHKAVCFLTVCRGSPLSPGKVRWDWEAWLGP